MADLTDSGLVDACAEMIVGINGGNESLSLAADMFPAKANIVLHGLDSRNENSTIQLVEKVSKKYPEAYVFYFHAKGATRAAGSDWSIHANRWRGCMMHHLVQNWRDCVASLDSGIESVGCHWLQPPQTPRGQYIWAGNFWWARASFLRTLPPLADRERIALSGLKALESRYEAEVWIGNGPRRPVYLDKHPCWHPVDACPIIQL